MEIIYVIIGITCLFLVFGAGYAFGTRSNISKFYEASLPIVQKTDKMMDPMYDFYLKMMKED